MNAELWQEFFDGVEDYDGDTEAWDAVAMALESMRQPITKDEMRRDGWNEVFDGYFKHRTCTVVFPSIYREELNHYIVRIGDALIRNARTMYDLRELVRLMGGAQ